MSSNRKKSENLAFFLNFVFPGAGLLYLGRSSWAVANLCLVLLIGVGLAFGLPKDLFNKYIQYVAVGVAGGSGGLAMALAKQMNATASATDQK